ncbi:MAG: thioredoxin domain-containing protein [Acidobacteria bacterium]|nr:thioredoxin domain-containing protein [Acidobacteriota bacterium]
MNRLSRERSPYLLQHADNPVDWFPWGDEAFARARLENKPIFLSIGYSTCHWCHVMAHESFELAEIGRLLNDRFVSIKVDREERPDVDRVYMAFVQATTGSGGWPMSVWLTPDLKPFYGGTYFPPVSRWGRPGFTEILQEIARAWAQDCGQIAGSAESIINQLRSLEQPGAAPAVPGADALARTVQQFREAFDARHGGFGSAPKFPRPSELLFLLREHARTGNVDALDMALRTLRAMALGGMRDQIGGGFHRYSVDAAWRVPHFEKMLYDQAQLALAFIEAALASGEQFFAAVAGDTLQYVLRDMTDPAGGFYSAEDADSLPPELAGAAGGDGAAPRHEAEGAFYLWGARDVDALLGADAAVVKLRFGIEAGGNAPADPHQEFAGRNLLYVAHAIDEIVARTGTTAEEVAATLVRGRSRMFEARCQRPRPRRDDKVLTAWNGLMIGALSRMARLASGRDESRGASAPYLLAAARGATFVRERLWVAGTQTLLRRYRGGHAEIEAYAEDYACLIFGLIELFQADASPAWLEWAIELQHRQDELFWDDAGGGWFSTTGRDPSVLLRMKEDYDGAEPTASSMSVMNLLMLSHLVDEPAWSVRIEKTLRLFGTRLERMGRAVPMMAAALSTEMAGLQQIVIAIPAAAGSPEETALVREVAGRYLPFTIALTLTPERRAALAARLPMIAAMQPVGGGAAAYLCRNFTCRPPVTTPEDLAAALAV